MICFVFSRHPERCFLRWQWPHQPEQIFPRALPAGVGAAAAADAAQTLERESGSDNGNVNETLLESPWARLFHNARAFCDETQ